MLVALARLDAESLRILSSSPGKALSTGRFRGWNDNREPSTRSNLVQNAHSVV